MNLSAEFESTVEAIQSIRELQRVSPFSKTYIDFRKIRSITPAAALYLAAELDRWNRLQPHRRLRAVDVDAWDPSVRSLLGQMGFFELLGVNRRVDDLPVEGGDPALQRFLPFTVGELADGGVATNLRNSIEAFAGRIKGRLAMYDGLVEAMANVAHHAYPERKGMRRWWVSASLDSSGNKLTVLCLDHGVGIPRTLPRTSGESIRNIVRKMALDSSDDAQMILAATRLSRSGTGKRYRGYGLQKDIRRYVKSHDSSARLRILSNRGIYVFTKDRDGNERTELINKSLSLGGTLVEWTLEDFAMEAL